MKEDRRYKFEWSRYGYAPESINFFNHGERVIIDYSNSMIRQNAACGRDKEVIIELKRIVRKQQKKHGIYYTIGFKTSNGEIVYPQYAHTSNRFDLKFLLFVYKSMKADFERKGWQHNNVMLQFGIIEFDKNRMIKNKSSEEFAENRVFQSPVLIKLKYV